MVACFILQDNVSANWVLFLVELLHVLITIIVLHELSSIKKPILNILKVCLFLNKLDCNPTSQLLFERYDERRLESVANITIPDSPHDINAMIDYLSVKYNI